MNQSPRVLVVDDDPSILEVLDARLSASEFRVSKARDAASAARILDRQSVDLMVSDVKMPRKSGMELFAEIRRTHPDLPVIFLTAYGTIPDAVEAIKQGAVDYISKPFDGRELIQKINGILSAKNSKKSRAVPDTLDCGYYWGKSPGMASLYEMVQKVSDSDVNILILGESGVGKEGLARYLHQSSKRVNHPYTIVDCGSTPAGILESELFGHLKGAFTHAVKDKKGLIQSADKGTLFLDEIGNISHDMQCRLLRFLEDGRIRQVGAVTEEPVDCRVIAATNADLIKDIETGSFRRDLYYRLKGITLSIPPLRERTLDIPELSNLFADRYTSAHGMEPIVFSDAAMSLLLSHSWAGNVRELKNAVEAGVVLCRNKRIRPEDLQLEIASMEPAGREGGDAEPFSIEASEKETIIRALIKARGVQKDAADLMNISKRTIHYKIKKYNIKPLAYK